MRGRNERGHGAGCPRLTVPGGASGRAVQPLLTAWSLLRETVGAMHRSEHFVGIIR